MIRPSQSLGHCPEGVREAYELAEAKAVLEFPDEKVSYQLLNLDAGWRVRITRLSDGAELLAEMVERK